MKFIKETINFFKEIIEKRYLIYELTKRDFSQQYVQNILGLVWAVLDPLSFMLILWFVFGVGLRSGRNMSVPFVAYLITGLASYNYFRNTLTSAASAIRSYSFLVRKVNFRISILPLVKILSNLFLHMIIIIVVIVILLLNKVFPSLYWIQVIYYAFSCSIMLMGLSWFTSAIDLFFPDLKNIINIITQFLFYFTPIFWDIKIFPEKLHIFLKINPMYYIVNGYRDSLVFQDKWFWEHPELTIYFWSFTFLSLLIGIIVFKKLKAHFGDVV